MFKKMSLIAVMLAFVSTNVFAQSNRSESSEPTAKTVQKSAKTKKQAIVKKNVTQKTKVAKKSTKKKTLAAKKKVKKTKKSSTIA